MSTGEELICKSLVWRGPRAGQLCGRRASMIVYGTRTPNDGMPLCGVHARTWSPRALARIAYFDARTENWP